MLCRPRYDKFLSCLMSYAWTLSKSNKKNVRFSKALKSAWATAKEELKGQALPLVTPNWNYESAFLYLINVGLAELLEE